MKRYLCMLFMTPLLFVFLLRPLCFCEDQGDKLAILSTIADKALHVNTIKSDYVQTRYTSMLKKPIITKGSFFYEKPDRLRWEISKPSPAGFVVNGERARRWMGDPGRAEPFELSMQPAIRSTVEQVFAWARADIAWIEKRYRVIVTEDSNTKLMLHPLSPQEKKFVRSIILQFSDDLSHLRSVKINEQGGDSMAIVFENTNLNVTLPRDTF